jgi:mono/diheme cytochrome c family protein
VDQSSVKRDTGNITRRRRAVVASVVAAPLLLLAAAAALPDKTEPTGEQIYRAQCASCHGARGEGTKSYARALTGTKSLPDLGTFIQKSMPPRAPKKLTSAEAKRVAAYVFDAYYSPIAQARTKTARIELSHLTVRQYRNVVADLVGSFRPSVALDDRRGLRGEYFKAGRFRRNERVLERIDPEVHFDYGDKGALPEQADPYQFCMSWEGSVLTQDTGEYEFIVRTDHAIRFWVNDLKQPLLDAYVKSGDGNEYRRTIFLLGGRAYPIRLEFTKGVNGVNDLSKIKQKPPAKSSISLEWRPPKRIVEVIPQRNLSPVTVPEVYTVTTPFPPDDRSMGFERASSVSKAWEEATTQAAIETSAYIFSHAEELAGGVAPVRREGPGSVNPSELNR